MKARELRELDAGELDQRIREMTQELTTLRIKHRSGIAIEKPTQLRGMRREIARMKTVKAQREAK